MDHQNSCGQKRSVQVKEAEPWREGTETWRVLRAYFSGSIETLSIVQLS
jgi:hypothetical protein